ncbi:hypothetical protein HMPREF0495_01760, partial [Levilactobacillus brevis ATCC 14869 = DSM 20054]
PLPVYAAWLSPYHRGAGKKVPLPTKYHKKRAPPTSSGDTLLDFEL